MELQEQSTPTWHVVGASVVGTSHLKIGRGCDDAHAYRLVGNDMLVLAVADGAGSAKYSAFGAKCAVSSALSTCNYFLAQQAEPTEEEHWRQLLCNVLEVVRATVARLAASPMITDADPHQNVQQTQAVGDSTQQQVMLNAIWQEVSPHLELPALSQSVAAQQTEINTEEVVPSPSLMLPLREFATTLLLAIVTPQAIAVVQIGDGAIVVQQPDGSFQLLTWPDHGEYINETSFITEETYFERTRYVIQPRNGVQGVALFTDGIERLAIDTAEQAAYEPFFTPLFKFAASSEATEAELQTFLKSERVCSRTDDDKTLVLAVHL